MSYKHQTHHLLHVMPFPLHHCQCPTHNIFSSFITHSCNLVPVVFSSPWTANFSKSGSEAMTPWVQHSYCENWDQKAVKTTGSSMLAHTNLFSTLSQTHQNFVLIAGYGHLLDANRITSVTVWIKLALFMLSVVTLALCAYYYVVPNVFGVSRISPDVILCGWLGSKHELIN